VYEKAPCQSGIRGRRPLRRKGRKGGKGRVHASALVFDTRSISPTEEGFVSVRPRTRGEERGRKREGEGEKKGKPKREGCPLFRCLRFF